MSALLFSSLDDECASPITLSNRALSYGDGVFETLRVIDQTVPLVDYHRARFMRGVEVLKLGSATDLLRLFDEALEQALVKLALLDHQDGLIKVFGIRSAGGRGYAPTTPCFSQVYFQVFESPHYPSSYAKTGIELAHCAYRLSEQPALAGIKHLNRLDQVLASMELGPLPEGLMCDQAGRVIEGTKSNVLVFMGDKIVTPDLSRAGVRGTMLSALLAGELPSFSIRQDDISFEQLMSADSIAMINSVFGLWPVIKVDGVTFEVSQMCRSLQTSIMKRFGFAYEAH